MPYLSLRKLSPSMEKLLHPEPWIAYLSVAMGSVLSFITPIVPFVATSAGLVLIDLITGIWAARKRGEVIRSKNLGKTVQKFLVYFLAMLAAEGMRITFLPSAPFTYVVALGICLTEFQSLIENVEAITGVNLWSRLKQLIQSLPQK